MATLYANQLASGYTKTAYKTALLDMLTTAWGAPTTAAGSISATQYSVWELGGGYLYINWGNLNNATTTITAEIAVDYDDSGGYRIWKASQNSGRGVLWQATDNSNSASSKMQFIALGTADFKAIATLSGTNTAGMYVAASMTPSEIWGANPTLVQHGGAQYWYNLAGKNPWGVWNPATKTASTVGIVQNQMVSPLLPVAMNTVIGKYLTYTDHFVVNTQDITGGLPSEFVVMGRDGLAANGLRKYQDADGKTYVQFYERYGFAVDDIDGTCDALDRAVVAVDVRSLAEISLGDSTGEAVWPDEYQTHALTFPTSAI